MPSWPKLAANQRRYQLISPITQRFCCVVIPELIDVGGPWNVLPPGIHDASLDEVKMQFATNPNRERLFDGFTRGFGILQDAGSKEVCLDGSFVTDKPTPEDFDCCWDAVGVDVAKLDPVFLDFSDKRAAQKEKYGGEFFPSGFEAAPGEFFLNYFQKEKHTGKTKGILRVH
jgi:hypothetical protein